LMIVSWNVNGLRSVIRKPGFWELIKGNHDLILLQEIKIDSVPIELNSSGYTAYVNSAKRKGYSGVLTLSKPKPLRVLKGIGRSKFDSEGRVLTLEFESLFVVNAYFVNAQRGLVRLEDKLEFDDLMLDYLERLRKVKPVVVCGDFNVAHTEIDIARPKDNVRNAGFTPEEREWMTRLLERGYVDTFRMFVKEGGHYTWWSYRFRAREKNIGWRIDYCIVSHELKDKVVSSRILNTIAGSDHVPVALELSA
jgi:exodeoxyribonuclease-3